MLQVKKDSYDLLKELNYEEYRKAIEVAACIIANLENAFKVGEDNNVWRYDIERTVVGHTLSLIERLR